MNTFSFCDDDGGIRARIRKREYDFLVLIVIFVIFEVSLLNVAFFIAWKSLVFAEL